MSYSEGRSSTIPSKSLFASAATILDAGSGNNNDESGSAAAKIKFSSNSLSPLSKDQQYQDASNKNLHRETNDLENMKVSLASSTLDAILAVQQTSQPKREHRDFQDVKKSRNWSPVVLNSEGKDTSSGKRKKKKQKEKHKKRKKHRKEYKYRSDDSSSSSDRNRRSPSPLIESSDGKVFLEDLPSTSFRKPFRIDRKANKYLLSYQSVSKYHIAKYRLASKRCVGNSNIFADVHWDTSKKKEKKMVPRYFGKEGMQAIRKRPIACLTESATSVSGFRSQPDYIKVPIEDDGGNTNNSNNNSNNANVIGTYSSLDEATALYSQGKGLESNLNSQSDNDLNLVMDELFEKVAKFNKQIREEPNNIELWVEFVKFQDVVAMEDKSFKRQTLHLYDVYRPTKAVIEKKIAILEKALVANPSSLELKKMQLELYQDIWEADKMERAWEDLLFVHSSNVELWRYYLCEHQANLHTFSFNKMVKKYHKCFQTLIPIAEGEVKVINKSTDMEQEMLGLFLQYCCFLHQSGYTERAVSSFQAIIEMNIFCPSDLNLSSGKDRLTRFEKFWDCSAPKFGDKNAKGWSEWEKKSHATDVGFLPVSTEETEDNILLAGLPKSKTWFDMEKARCHVYWLPWKPDESKGETEDNCEDPDRLVLFEDISPTLFRVTNSQSCIQLVCLFLSFLGFKTNVIEKVVECISLGKDSSHNNGYLLDELHQIEFKPLPMQCFSLEKDWDPHQQLLKFINEIILQSERFFSSTSRDVFTLARFDLELKRIGASEIHTLSASQSKEIKKFGKNLLKESQNRNNLVVWDTYIRLLWVVSDKMEETVSMIETALGMFLGANSLTNPQKAKGICLLCRTFAEIMLNFDPSEYVSVRGRRSSPSLQDKRQVIGCIGALIDGTKFKKSLTKLDSSSLFILRIKNRAVKIIQDFLFNVQNESSASYSICDTTIAFLNCYALFEYCAFNFKSANEIFNSVGVQVKDKETNLHVRYFLKNLYSCQINFILNVMHVESISLGKLRTVLDSALKTFPDHSYFHKTFLDVESASFLSGRLRRFYDQRLKSSPSVINVMYAALSELMRLTRTRKEDILQSGVAESGLVNRIRSIFQHSLDVKACAHSPLLWRMWLGFEVQYGTMPGAKGILYRGLQCCPWSKSIYMDGVQYFGDKELTEIFGLMAEKELRVCMPLEEVDLLMTADTKSDEDKDCTDSEEDMEEESLRLGDA